MFKTFSLLLVFMFAAVCHAQSFDTTKYKVEVDTIAGLNNFFKQNEQWRGGDGASSVYMGNGKTLWLFGDTFISDSAGSRINAALPRNTIAIQNGKDLKTATINYYWDKTKKTPGSFFSTKDSTWYWPGHGIVIKDKLLVFFMKIKQVPTDFGFETIGWDAALISNPGKDPLKWKMKFITGGQTFGTVAGSAALLKDNNHLYAFGAVEPGSHDVHLLRWNIDDAYKSNLTKPEWWMHDKWGEVHQSDLPKPLFAGATEYSVHYDSTLKKFIQVQSYGFGEASIGLRMADKLEGPWSEPFMIYTPAYTNIHRPFMYSAKAHPELSGDGFLVTYNINSFDSDELLKNQSIYFPRFIRVHISKK